MLGEMNQVIYAWIEAEWLEGSVGGVMGKYSECGGCLNLCLLNSIEGMAFAWNRRNQLSPVAIFMNRRNEAKVRTLGKGVGEGMLVIMLANFCSICLDTWFRRDK
jgi:hypothetical protein